MYATVLRLGLWTLILVLALYVLAATYPNRPWAELIPEQMLQQALIVAVVLIAAGIVLRVLGFGAKVVQRNRCRVCGAVVPHGAIYCREHLRTILADEDERSHRTHVRRR